MVAGVTDWHVVVVAEVEISSEHGVVSGLRSTVEALRCLACPSKVGSQQHADSPTSDVAVPGM
jgi:hypothetical protein